MPRCELNGLCQHCRESEREREILNFQLFLFKKTEKMRINTFNFLLFFNKKKYFCRMKNRRLNEEEKKLFFEKVKARKETRGR